MCEAGPSSRRWKCVRCGGLDERTEETVFFYLKLAMEAKWGMYHEEELCVLKLCVRIFKNLNLTLYFIKIIKGA